MRYKLGVCFNVALSYGIVITLLFPYEKAIKTNILNQALVWSFTKMSSLSGLRISFVMLLPLIAA